MLNSLEIYCARCQKTVALVKGIVNFFCPKCGLVFTPGQLESADNDESDNSEPEPGR